MRILSYVLTVYIYWFHLINMLGLCHGIKLQRLFKDIHGLDERLEFNSYLKKLFNIIMGVSGKYFWYTVFGWKS